MKCNDRLAAGYLTLGVLFAAQAVFLFALPVGLIVLFSQARPVLYAVVTSGYFAFMGQDERPVPKAGRAALLGAIGAILYFAATLIAGVLLGFGKNRMTSGFPVVASNIGVYAAAAFLSELLRFKLVKSTPDNNRPVLAVVLTIVYAFTQLSVLRGISAMDVSRFLETLFASVLPALTLNAVLTYVAYEGSLRALLFIRGAYSLAPVFLPIVPNISDSAWAAVSCGLLLVTVVFYHRNMSDRSRRFQNTAKRRAKYQKKTVLSYSIPLAIAAFLIAFGIRAFVYYPVVIYSGSMTGAIDRGAVAFIEKLPHENVFSAVNEGDIIHYTYNKREMTHRVIELSYNAAGERVYITKGDANPVADGYPVEMEQVLGITRAYIPYIGYPVVIVNALRGG